MRFQQDEQAGQTSVEYILLLMVVMLITMSAMKEVRAFFLPDGECTRTDRSLVCAFERVYDRQNLKIYRFPK